MNKPENDRAWWDYYTAYCRQKFHKQREKGQPVADAMYLAFEQTIELRTIPGLETRFKSVNFEVLNRWAEKYDKVVDALYKTTNPSQIRFCEQCGFPMVEGYYLGGEYACCEQCCVKAYGYDTDQMQKDLSHSNEPDSEYYWTEWPDVTC